jgi:hypothetical protein
MTAEELLAEVDDLLRSMPPRNKLDHNEPENFAWLGRVSAFLYAWHPVRGAVIAMNIPNIQSNYSDAAINHLLVGLHEARHDLAMKTAGPSSVVIAHSRTFQYFDELRKIIETATTDILFIDQFLDAEFVSRYLGNVKEGVVVRLLTTPRYLKSLLPAVAAFVDENPFEIHVRFSTKLHDRFVFIDRAACYQSGASFKDGAKNSPATVSQIHDAFDAMLQTYEAFWEDAKVIR